jgi:hypothetical protein
MNSIQSKEVPQWAIFEISLNETVTGNLTPEEITSRFWLVYCRGGYCTHGETYRNPKKELRWAKDGTLYGKNNLTVYRLQNTNIF